MTLVDWATRHPRSLEGAIRLDRLPPALWLLATALALWPAWAWMGARMLDRSDDPLGLLALAALGLFAWRSRRTLRASPRLGLLSLAALLVLGAALARAAAVLPPLLLALLAVLALACTLLAFLPPGQPALPVLGLSALALPLLSSLQFYAGYPLRLVAAEAARWLLAPFFTVERAGSSLWIDGRLVIVDAPCSGVQMVWMGYFTACMVALFLARLDDRVFLRRLPAVGALVLAGNVLRNALLIGLEGAGHAAGPLLHQALGLVLLAAVCAGIGGLMRRPPTGGAADALPAKEDRHALA